MSKLRRPTIPIADWRIATQLEETKNVQGHHKTPAFECDCSECSRWRKNWQKILPDSLVVQLVRFGIDPAKPTDIYGGESPRINYHVIGKIISGPDSFYEHDHWGKSQRYQLIRKEPALSISIARSMETSGAAPEIAYEYKGTSELIIIDLRLEYPKSLQNG